MTITEQEYQNLLSNPHISDRLREEVANTARLEQWVFVGT